MCHLDAMMLTRAEVASAAGAMQDRNNNHSPSPRILQALKADTASITAWQVGMFGFIAIAQFLWFQRADSDLIAPVVPI